MIPKGLCNISTGSSTLSVDITGCIDNSCIPGQEVAFMKTVHPWYRLTLLITVVIAATLITGSFNFTRAAEEKNAENLLVMKGNQPLVDRYIRNYADHKGYSEGYQGK
jgi:phosphatidylserine/phosphatidylglycerophosphate/cardiolipin synthase-like enzyme